MGYKIGSFYITELCNALTRYAPKLVSFPDPLLFFNTQSEGLGMRLTHRQLVYCLDKMLPLD